MNMASQNIAARHSTGWKWIRTWEVVSASAANDEMQKQPSAPRRCVQYGKRNCMVVSIPLRPRDAFGMVICHMAVSILLRAHVACNLVINRDVVRSLLRQLVVSSMVENCIAVSSILHLSNVNIITENLHGRKQTPAPIRCVQYGGKLFGCDQLPTVML